MNKSLLLIILFTALCLLPGYGYATENETTSYDYTITYAGRYQSDLLFQRHDRHPFWQAQTSAPKLISDISCQSALATLHTKGVWTGNLSTAGQCLGSAEAPEYSYGNYLNYLAGE